MNVLDIALALVIVSAIAGGFQLGLIARVASWIGALGGMFLAIRLLPRVIERMGAGPPLPRLVLIIGGILLGAAIGGSIGEFVGRRLRRVVAFGPLKIFDSMGGAAVGAIGVLVSLWLLLPVLADVPGVVARFVRASRVLAFVDDVTPPPPDAMRALRGYLGEDRFPEVFAGLQPAPDTGPPPADIPLAAETLARVTASTVNVETVGCGARHEGSGFAVSADTIVTNAHVVAGAERIQVRRPDQRLVDARVIRFDAARDLAVLDAPGLGQQPLPIANAPVGTEGAVVGYPGGQNQPRPTPMIISDERATTGYDIYNRSTVDRQVLFLAASLRQGDSGSPVFDVQGRVVGVAFAIAPDRPGTAYAVDDSELRTVLAAPASGNGPCP